MALAETAGLLDWVLNGTQVGAKVMMLRKTWWAPIIYAWMNDQWGFLITPLVMGPIYALSIKKWSLERYEHEYVEAHMEEYVIEEHMKHPDWARNLLAQYGDDEEREKYGGNIS
jgi:hypothetical protein